MTAYDIVYLGIFFTTCALLGVLAGCVSNFFMNQSFWPFLVRRHWAKRDAMDREMIGLMQQSQSELMVKIGQAYQVVGFVTACTDGEAPWPPADEFIRAMDYFSADDFDEDFLPWPRVIQKVEAETVQ